MGHGCVFGVRGRGADREAVPYQAVTGEKGKSTGEEEILKRERGETRIGQMLSVMQKKVDVVSILSTKKWYGRDISGKWGRQVSVERIIREKRGTGVPGLYMLSGRQGSQAQPASMERLASEKPPTAANRELRKGVGSYYRAGRKNPNSHRTIPQDKEAGLQFHDLGEAEIKFLRLKRCSGEAETLKRTAKYSASKKTNLNLGG